MFGTDFCELSREMSAQVIRPDYYRKHSLPEAQFKEADGKKPADCPNDAARPSHISTLHFIVMSKNKTTFKKLLAAHFELFVPPPRTPAETQNCSAPEARKHISHSGRVRWGLSARPRYEIFLAADLPTG